MKTLLAGLFCLLTFPGFSQTNDATVEKFCQQIEDVSERDGRNKALMLTEIGLKYLAPRNPKLEKLRYETFYNAMGFGEGYEEEYALSFTATSWSKDGSRIAAAMSDGTVRLYSSLDLSQYETLDIGEEEDTVWDVDWSPDGNYLAFCILVKCRVDVHFVTTTY